VAYNLPVSAVSTADRSIVIGKHLGGLRSVETGAVAVQFVPLIPQGQRAAFALATEIKVFQTPSFLQCSALVDSLFPLSSMVRRRIEFQSWQRLILHQRDGKQLESTTSLQYFPITCSPDHEMASSAGYRFIRELRVASPPC